MEQNVMERPTEQAAALLKYARGTESFVAKMESLIRAAGQKILEADAAKLAVTQKTSRRDIVTSYDTAIQTMLVEGLAALCPGAGFLCEEGSAKKLTDGISFIIDPIDGTSNFVHDCRFSCIAVAMTESRQVERAFVYNPYADEMFFAQRGVGAFLNGSRLKIENCAMENGLVSFGTSPYDPALWDEAFRLARLAMQNCMDLRRTGSAELDLCAVAAGRSCLYFEPMVSPWDQAAGALIVQESGGRATTLEGGVLPVSERTGILAGTPSAWSRFMRIMQEGASQDERSDFWDR